ncbi:outer membrane insertion C-terminal signal [Chryseobacterium sp. RU37D]|uniref:hypothetical protein n=1 Tax=Chryseobacterium sp. RU37D TaxID=1907397 RepID=UPI00095578C8|nr:hypothetical protein [Chryseobacterium sp. RU37D]SIQ87668.1 outer membrane insertion C-terminal signal [Chryseobacterium sp. RU37D]
MKKIILIAAMAVFGWSFGQKKLSNSRAGLKAGIHLGIPVGDASDVSDDNIGLDVSYLWNVTKNLDLGIATGFDLFIGKFGQIYTIDVNQLGSIPGTSYNEHIEYTSYYEDIGYIPIAATAKYNFSKNWFAGLDLGYAISTSSRTDGGFYYNPKAGYQLPKWEFLAFYKGVADNGLNISSIGIGVNYKFKSKYK